MKITTQSLLPLGAALFAAAGFVCLYLASIEGVCLSLLAWLVLGLVDAYAESPMQETRIKNQAARLLPAGQGEAGRI